jgi:C1A family cysteine protease
MIEILQDTLIMTIIIIFCITIDVYLERKKENNSMPKYRYGWRADKPDQRDHLFAAPLQGVVLPAKVDLRPGCPMVYDQGQLGSCTANAIAGALEYDQIKQKLAEATPSRLFIYYNERVMEHSVSEDAGAEIRDGVKSVNKQGACAELLWPYDITKFAIRPTAQCYNAAHQHRTVSYQRVPQSLTQMKACLASGYPIIFGFTVYESFESQQVANTGIVPMPAHYESALGGHAVLCVGYDDATQRFLVRNSWSDQWGDKGYCYMPYAYLLSRSLASDFWTIKTTN